MEIWFKNVTGIFTAMPITDPHLQVWFLHEESYEIAMVELVKFLHAYPFVPRNIFPSRLTIQKARLSPSLTGKTNKFFSFEISKYQYSLPASFFRGLIDTVLFK